MLIALGPYISYFHGRPILYRTPRRSSAPLTQASFSPPSQTAEELQRRFGCESLSFSSIAGLTAMQMKLSNKSTARLALPHAILTSYKPLMWHGATEELLHSHVSTQQNGFLVHGGISLFASFSDENIQNLWSQKRWLVDAVDVQPQNYVQVCLTSLIKMEGTEENILDHKSSLVISYIITLLKTTLTTAISISNKSSISVKFNSSISTFLATNSPDAVFAGGLRGFKFQLIDTQEAKPAEKKSDNLLGHFRRSQVERKISVADKSTVEDSKTSFDFGELWNKGDLTNWVTEREDYAPFQSRMGRLYANSGDNVLIIDRGKRRSVISKRLGFQNFFLSGPSLDFKLGVQDDYICFGPLSVVQEIDLKPGQKWQGAQILQNKNL